MHNPTYKHHGCVQVMYVYTYVHVFVRAVIGCRLRLRPRLSFFLSAAVSFSVLCLCLFVVASPLHLFSVCLFFLVLLQLDTRTMTKASSLEATASGKVCINCTTCSTPS